MATRQVAGRLTRHTPHCLLSTSYASVHRYLVVAMYHTLHTYLTPEMLWGTIRLGTIVQPGRWQSRPIACAFPMQLHSPTRVGWLPSLPFILP
ncbi:hypothetical protein CGRA01v4_10732 [Colletotrichum graminicola]|nr:hypothetical protein CGRA01v4_10732 [Colletotrichum graminicola]